MRIIISSFFLITLIFIITIQVNAEADMSKVKIVYGISEIYSREDMDEAITIIKEVFKKWEGCELHSIRYTDDDYCNTEENIKWMNELAKARGFDGDFTQCIGFFSDFHSPKYDNQTTFNTDSEYTNWSWYLARKDSGNWHLITFGY